MKNLSVLLLIIIILSALFIFTRSFLPVVRVEGESLFWRDFSKNRAGLKQFRELSKENISDLDIEKGVILAFIENTLIQKELKLRGRGEEDVQKLIRSTVSDEELSNLEDAVARLYDWSLDDFKKFILYPQSRRLLIMEEFQKENIEPDQWLENSLSANRISIYLPRWKWEDGEVQRRY